MHATLPLLQSGGFPAIRRRALKALQVNLGYRCNQSCLHCHVNAGPTRTEAMDDATVETVLEFLVASGVGILDITGGAPELHPRFRHLVERARAIAVRVIDRCNLHHRANLTMKRRARRERPARERKRSASGRRRLPSARAVQRTSAAVAVPRHGNDGKIGTRTEPENFVDLR